MPTKGMGTNAALGLSEGCIYSGLFESIIEELEALDELNFFPLIINIKTI